MVLRIFEKAKSCEGVIKDLKANKAFKDRVPDNYYETLKKVKTIFKF